MPEPIIFQGYAPDLPSNTPGVFTDCAAILPSTRGFKAAPTPTSFGLAALAAQCRGAASLKKRDETPRTFAGTSANMYERSVQTWASVTGAAFVGLGSADRWRFAQLGDASLITAKTEIPRFITSGASFAVVAANAPRGAIIETVNNFVFLFDVNDQGAIFDSAERQDGWWCAGRGNYTSWTPAITTEAATGTLQSTPGKIVAGRRFGYQIVAYKLRSMYLGTYVGPPLIWDFQLVPGEAGALSQEAVVNIGTPEEPKHIFMGLDNFYLFNGGRPVPIGNPVRESVFAEFNQAFYYAALALHDAVGKRVYFFYPVSGSEKPDKCVVYNYETQRWGRDDRQVEFAFDALPAGVTYDGLGALYSTYSDFPAMSYDLAFAASGSGVPTIFDTSHVPRSLNGSAGNSSITLGDYGDDQSFFTLNRLRPRFISAPTSAQFTHSWRDNLSDSKTAEGAIAISSGRFDTRRSARWHSGTMSFVGDLEIQGFSVDGEFDGDD